MKFTEHDYGLRQERWIVSGQHEVRVTIILSSLYENVAVRINGNVIDSRSCEAGKGAETAAEMVRVLRDALTAALEE